MRVAPKIMLTIEEEKTLARLSRSNTASVRLARRAQIVLLAAAGLDNKVIAAELSVGRVQVGRWRERYAESGLASIERDLPRSGRKPIIDAAEIVRLTTRPRRKRRPTGAHEHLPKRQVSAIPRYCGCGSLTV